MSILLRPMSVARSSLAAVLGAGLLAIVACDSGSDTAADGGAGSGGSSGSAGTSSADKVAPDGLYGSFTLRLVPPVEATGSSPSAAAQTSFIGFATEGETPIANAWVQDQTANGCSLFTPKAPFCDPACGSSAVCVSDDKCVKNPTSKAVGTIVLKDLKDGDVSMSPLGSNNNYQPKAGTTLPFPPCEAGASLRLAVEGGAYKSFELKSRCIAPLEFNDSLRLVKGSAAKVEWKAPSDTKLARIKVRLDISHHGGSRGKIECDVEDTGSLELSAAMVTKLLDLGVAGYPTVILTRLVSGGVASGEPENVQFLVQESVERSVEIDGLLSCTEDSQCPAPKTCQSDLTCK